MTVRMILATAVAGALAAGSTSAATGATSALRSCGTISIAGKPWAIVAQGVSCASAKTLIRKLAAMPHPASHIYPGIYMGMRCVDGSKPGKPAVTCLSPSADKQVGGGVKR